jgi:hypothetical protein
MAWLDGLQLALLSALFRAKHGAAGTLGSRGDGTAATSYSDRKPGNARGVETGFARRSGRGGAGRSRAPAIADGARALLSASRSCSWAAILPSSGGEAGMETGPAGAVNQPRRIRAGRQEPGGGSRLVIPATCFGHLDPRAC